MFTRTYVLLLKGLIRIELNLKFIIMKRFTSLILLLIVGTLTYGQTYPVAVEDYASAKLEEYVTVNVTDNDYHPDGLTFRVNYADGCVSFTDSTITYGKFDLDTYYNQNDTITYAYRLIDEDGLFGYESMGKVKITIEDTDPHSFLEINNIRARIQPSGIQFWPGPGDDYAVYEFPKGSGKTSMFNTALWIGGLDDNENLRLAGTRYQQVGLDFWPGPLSVDGDELSIDTSTMLEWFKVWKLSKDEVVYHRLHWYEDDYEPIEQIANWPAHGDADLNQSYYLAPFMDIDGDSVYNPFAGDYPLIRGDECAFFIINDVRTHDETDGEQIGLEIHGMAYEFYNDEILQMNNTLFLSYKVFNRSSTTLNDCYISIFSDIDLGYPYDDYVGCDVERGAYFGYNGVEVDGNGEPEAYGENPPAQGVIILGGPTMDENGIDDPDNECNESINGVGFGDGISDNERLGMTNFIYFNNGGSSATSDPSITADYYNYMKGIWRDGTSMEYGGNGHVTSGAYGPAANFMFPGLSDPCFWGTGGEEPYGQIEWTEESLNNAPGDRRGLSAMGPFTFEAGTMERIDFAFVSAFPEDEQTSVETLLDYIDIVKDEYYKDPTYFGYQWLDVENKPEQSIENKIQISPNPTNGNVRFSCADISSNAEYRVLSITGEILMKGNIYSNEPVELDMSGWTSGIYILTITDNQNTFTDKILKR